MATQDSGLATRGGSPSLEGNEPTPQQSAGMETAARATFSTLPREMRDLIYEHLLSGELVIDMPYSAKAPGIMRASNREVSAAHTYSFQTAILATSKQMFEEASKILKVDIPGSKHPGRHFTAWMMTF